MSDGGEATQRSKRRGAESAVQLVAALVEESRSGILEIRTGETCQRLRLSEGGIFFEAGEGAPTMEELIRHLAESPAKDVHFLPLDGPVVEEVGEEVAAAVLLMEASVLGKDVLALWKVLRGPATSLKVAFGSRLGASALPDIGEGLEALLSKFLQPRTLGEVVPDGEEEAAFLEGLVRLRTVGLLEPVSEKGVEKARGISTHSRELFLSRIRLELESRPPTLSPEQHRTWLADMLRNVGGWNSYEILGLDRHSDEPAIHRSFVNAACLAHPDNGSKLSLEGREAALDLIFDKVTEAYLQLSHPDRRRQYDHELGPEVRQALSEERQEEKSGVAREMYSRAKFLYMQEDFQGVLDLMQQAVILDSQAEYYKLLGEVQRRNPEWKRGAVESFREAVRLRPEDAKLRLSFGQVLEESGDERQAMVQYRAALELRPDLEDAQEALADLEDPKGKKRKKQEKQARAKASARAAKKPRRGEESAEEEPEGMFPTFTKLFRRGR